MRPRMLVLLLAFAMLVLAFACERGSKLLEPVDQVRIDSEAALIAELESAYSAMDLQRFAALLSTAEGAEFLFIPAEPTDEGETSWGAAEEIRIHQRMFEPQNAEPPLPKNLWLEQIDVSLRPLTPFQERNDLYRNAQSNPDGLDPQRWKVRESRYASELMFHTAGDLDFAVEGVQNFIVIEDLSKDAGDPARHLIYRWEDLGSNPKLTSTQPSGG